MVVGGVAVVLHAYLRATADLDIFLDLEQTNLDLALDFFERQGFRPRAPIPLRSSARPRDAEDIAALLELRKSNGKR
jgi:hypothetical protein